MSAPVLPSPILTAPRQAAARRLFATLRLDVRLQWRNGFYFATFFVLAVMALAFSQYRLEISWMLPMLVFSNLPINTYYFVAGLVLLEKGEGTLEAQTTSPLRSGEYLLSKNLSLAALSLLEALLVVWILGGMDLNPLLFSAGTVLGALLFTLCGFLLVARYDSINAYLLPSIPYLVLLLLPMLEAFGLAQSYLFYLHPFQAVLKLLQYSFGQGQPWEAVYGLLYGGLWVLVLWRLARRSFERFIVRREGE
jgi:fluoroquinolone transport system permease protein